MNNLYQSRLQAIVAGGGHAVIAGGRRGVEKECLRITPDGLIAQTPHPQTLGAALTNKYITTDYSEALLEFVTPPEPSAWAAMQFMCDIHQFTYQNIGEELLWPFSMPCRLRGQDDIPIAQYGSSNVGRMKSIYRNGLGHRYGRYMQAIAGIHFNYSIPEKYWEILAQTDTAATGAELKSEGYLGLVRNVRRMDWLMLYLFGASPAVCRSFLTGMDHQLEELDNGTCYGPWATSLRMSDLGYQNSTQSALIVSANSVAEYVLDLAEATRTPNADYVALGIKRDGEYLQLNGNQLQIENEFYSSVRPKRVAHSGERPTSALERGGVEYVELRCLDLSPFDPAGLGQVQQKFLEAFMIYCLLADSPPIDASEQSRLHSNHLEVARQGRKPGLQLQRGAGQVSLQDWATEILTEMQPICELLDGPDTLGYVESLQQQVAAVKDSGLTPSARLLQELSDAAEPFADYGLAKAHDYREYFSGLAPELNGHQPLFSQETRASLQAQQEIEAADKLGLDDYLARYYA
jgi:glutamate--cysteine ligase